MALELDIKFWVALLLFLQGSLEKAGAHSSQLAQELSKEKGDVSSLNMGAK